MTRFCIILSFLYAYFIVSFSCTLAWFRAFCSSLVAFWQVCQILGRLFDIDCRVPYHYLLLLLILWLSSLLYLVDFLPSVLLLFLLSKCIILRWFVFISGFLLFLFPLSNQRWQLKKTEYRNKYIYRIKSIQITALLKKEKLFLH